MGCFFGCFRTKDSASTLITPTEPAAASAHSKNALSSLFLCDGESLQKGKKGQDQLPRELDVRELKDEAKFLKACGTLSETPIEIRKASEKWGDRSTRNGEEISSEFNSWLPNASMEKLKFEHHSEESPIPVKIGKKWLTGSDSLVDSPSSCMTDGHNTGTISSSSIHRSDIQNVITPMAMRDSETHSETSSVSFQVFAPNLQCKNKPVRFDCESDDSAFSSKGSSSQCSSQIHKQSGSVGVRSVTKPAPYPTPLKLTDEMQTPGTVFPAYVNDKVRSRYVFSAPNTAENLNELEGFKDESSDPNQRIESLKLNNEDDSISTPLSELGVKNRSVGKDVKNEASLSSWLKPLSDKQDGNNEQFGSAPGKNVYWGKTPGDRPILGMVAAHWNEDEESHVSPKWWDGNGIPNSTNKYKEDQKVSWHATPFEERLEKALSEESFISQRKPTSGTPPFEFNETEESDTALSNLQSSAQIKSVVSF